MEYELFVTPGLGDNSYLLTSGGEAVVVDPQRDAWRFLAAADARKLRVRYVLETHDLCHAYLGGQPIQVLDVRQPVEWDTGYVPGSLRIHLGDLPARLADVPRDKEVWTACASGHRASIAASLLDRAGVPVRLVARGGVPEWLARCYPQVAGREAERS
jgi:rhodanese-related sulfurtransferase